MRNPRLRNLILAGLFAALISVLSQISFTLPGLPIVPVTLQVLVVLLAGGLLGSTYGALSMIVYLLLGAFGMRVFAGGHGGMGVLVGPTGGYLWSYPVVAWLIGFLAPARSAPGPVRTVAAMLGGLVVIYAGGAGWAILLGGKSMATVVSGWVLPFVPFDLAKLAIAAALSTAVNRALAALGYWPRQSAA